MKIFDKLLGALMLAKNQLSISPKSDVKKIKVVKSSIKKFLKILTVNFLILVILLFAADYSLCRLEFFKEEIYCKKINKKVSFPSYTYMIESFSDVYSSIQSNDLRRPEGTSSKNKPIIVFGCSFAFGDGLTNSQTFSHKLSLQTKRPIYNRAFSAWGIQHMLYQLKREDFYKQVKAPEYIVYVFISDHVPRLYFQFFRAIDSQNYLRYKNHKGLLEEDSNKKNPLGGFFISKSIHKYYENKFILNSKNNEENFDFMKMHFLEAKNIADQRFPGVKFVILKYYEEPDSWFLNTQRWKELEKEGFIVLGTTTLTSEHFTSLEYKLSDGHPNEKAWDVITPAFIKKLNL